MAASRLFYTNLIKSTPATLTAGSAATGYPATNLYQDDYSEVWRSTAAGASAEVVVADFGAAVSVSAVAFGNVNIRSTATVKIQGHTSDSWGTPDVDETINVSAMTGTRRNIYHELASSYSKRYWRLSVVDNGNPDGFIEIGQWFLGVAVTLTDAHDRTVPQQWVDNNVELRTDYGKAYVYDRDYAWQFDLSWTNVQEATINQLSALSVAQKRNQVPFFYVVDPTVPALAYYVRLTQGLQINRNDYDNYNARTQITEEAVGIIVPK